jgi:GNAT superfamily N-acetyltransferase
VHDHLDELERRLDVAAGAVDRLQVRRDTPPAGPLERLLRRTAFASRAADPERLRRMLAGSTETWSLWDGDVLVAFARVLTDGAFNAYVLTVAVDPAWQGRGAGTRLMESLLAGREHLSFALGARSGVDGFYRGLGFLPATWMMARRRTR